MTEYRNGNPTCKKEVWTGGECETEVVRISFNGRDHEHNNSGALHTSQEIWNFVKNYSLECGKVGSSGISFSSPSASGKYSDGDVLSISVKVGSKVEATKIVFSIDGDELTTISSEPWSTKWTATSGNHVIKAVATMSDGSTSEAETVVDYNTGDAVKITDGPFSGFDGTVEEIVEDRSKLKVVVMIFGRKTILELNFTQVTKELN